MSTYTIQINRRNSARELVEVSSGRVIDQADLDSPAACVALSQRLVILNAQAAAAELASLEAEAQLVDALEAFEPALALHYAVPAPVVTRAAIAHEITRARLACQDSPSWVEAVNKASVELERGCFTWDGSTLTIESRTHSGRFYVVTAEGCNCGHKCKWHRACYRLLANATRAAALPSVPAQPAAPLVAPRRPSYRPSAAYTLACAA